MNEIEATCTVCKVAFKYLPGDFIKCPNGHISLVVPITGITLYDTHHSG